VKCRCAAVALGENTEAVVLDFVNPARPGWRPLGGAGQTGFEALQLALQFTRRGHGGLDNRCGAEVESRGVT
jgi:hypothetical protein